MNKITKKIWNAIDDAIFNGTVNETDKATDNKIFIVTLDAIDNTTYFAVWLTLHNEIKKITEELK